MKRRGFLQLLAAAPLAAIAAPPVRWVKWPAAQTAAAFTRRRRTRWRVVAVRTGLPPCRFRQLHEGVTPSRASYGRESVHEFSDDGGLTWKPTA